MNAESVRTDIFREGDDLADFVVRHIPTLPDASVLAVASKVVALSEGRVNALEHEASRDALIREESDACVRSGQFYLTVKDGMVLPSAGIDESNGNGKAILHPKDAYRRAADLRARLTSAYGIKRLGIVIADSHIMPLRAGTTGIAIGYAGFRGTRDYRGSRDLFGRPLQYARTNIADSLATVAVLLMGEGAESTPLVIVRDAPVEFTDHISPDELRIDPEDDLYAPILRGLISE